MPPRDPIQDPQVKTDNVPPRQNIGIKASNLLDKSVENSRL